MTTRLRSVTAVGLPAREELLVRTLLKVVNTKTTDAWSFHDGLEANVALCNPDSALSMMAVKRSSTHGLLCVSVVHEGGRTLPETLTLRAPIRSSDFIDILNQASGQLQLHARTRRASAAEDERHESLAHTLRGLATDPHASYLRVHVGGRSLMVAFKARRIGSTQEVHDDELLMLGQSRSFQLATLDTLPGEADIAGVKAVATLDRLWWLSGLHAVSDDSSEIRLDRRYLLRRWPDAGRLRLQPFQLRMSAALTRHAMSAGELAAMVERPVSDAHAFLDGCAMLGLLTEAAPSSEPATPAPAAPRTSRYGELFQSLRAALGIRS